MSITSSVEHIDEVTKKFSVAVPAERVKSEFERAVSKVAAQASVKGFRPGKAPRKIVEQMHGERVRWDVAQELVSSVLSDLVREHKFDIVGRPEVDFAAVDPASDFQFTAQVALYPTPTIAGYEKFVVKIPKEEVTDAAVEKVIEEIRESKATSRPISDRREVTAGDVVEATVRIAVEGESDDSPAEPIVTKVGAGKIPADLDAGLTGMKVGESKTLETTFGDDHPNPKYRGKRGSYHVTVTGLREQILPEMTDEFAAGLESGVSTVLELRLKIREHLEKNVESENRGRVQSEILNQLVTGNQFPVPQVMVDDEIRNLLVRFKVIDPSKIDPSKVPVEGFREKLGETALQRVRTSVIVDRIAQQEKLTPSNEEIDVAIKELADTHGASVDEVRRYLLQGDRAVGFSLELARNKVLSFLEGRATIEPVTP